MEKYTALRERAEKYREMLEQVETFRETWDKKLKKRLVKEIKEIIKETELNADITQEENIKGLENISVRLGTRQSGIFQRLHEKTKKPFFKDFGTLVYSQLFNGKIQVWMTYPFIEGLMEPRPPKLIGIYAPPEFDDKLVLTHFESFFKDLIEWEDYDDDDPASPKPNAIGFGANMPDE